MKRPFLIVLLVSIVIPQFLMAQDSLNIFNTLLNPIKISYQRPDDTFIMNEDSISYYSGTYNSTITYMIFPRNYDEVVKDFKSNITKTMVDSTSITINNVWMHSFIEENIDTVNNHSENYYHFKKM
jgi:hypothetical protein